MSNELLLVLDFGGQYKELIARTARNMNVYSEIRPGNLSAADVKELNPVGIVLTGGPNSVYAEGAATCDPEIFNLGVPVLGICYGMHLMCHVLGGTVAPGGTGEYGGTKTRLDTASTLFEGVKEEISALMSHGDGVAVLPEGFKSTGTTAVCPNAAMENAGRGLFAVQFHPEVAHTEQGGAIFRNFLYNICKAKGDYFLDDYIERQIRMIREKVGDERVLLGLSGGVDSSVCAAILSKAIPGRLTCIFVDHGFMRLNEGDEIEAAFAGKNINFVRVNAEERFLSRIAGVTDPEEKRKLVGAEFARVFEEEAGKQGDIRFLAQGTIYPDMIESGGKLGATIKSHHNVGGLPENLRFAEVIEPLSGLFKDEVRALGRKLKLPKSLTERQPFPGPGLSIRVMGEVTREKLDILRRADHILLEEFAKLRGKPQQYFAVFTGVKSVGVKGDHRAYDYVIAIRAVTTTDFMTCEFARVPYERLARAAARIANEVKEVSRVVYDVTDKPPATLEWE